MADDWRADVALGHDVHLEAAPQALLLARALERGAHRIHLDGWTTGRKTIPAELGEPLIRVT